MRKTKIIIMIAIFIIVSMVPHPQHVFSSDKELIRVKVDILNVRSGPGLEYNVINKIHNGETYQLIEDNKAWMKIKINDSIGWVAGWLVEKVTTNTKVKTAESTVDTLNVRQGPSTNFDIIDQIHPNTKYPIIDEEGDWIKIQVNTNKFGWIAKWFSKIAEEAATNESVQSDYVTIQVNMLNVRKSPSTDSEIIGVVEKGDKVEVVNIENGWYKIKFKSGYGWITSKYASQITKSNGPSNNEDKQKVMVNTNILNLRRGPSTQYKIIGKLLKNDILIVLETNGDWLHIQKANSPEVKGWVANWLVVNYNHIVSNQPTVVILNPGTNIRSGPSTNDSVLTIAKVGDQFPIISTAGDWYQIKLKDGKIAYVAGWIVSVKGIKQDIKHGINKLLQNKVIVIDAGHGGKDYGATGTHFKSTEKVLNLQVAKLLEKKLEAAGAKVVMTRSTDIRIPLQERVDIAVNNHADAFISIHHNTNENTIINGTITYYYSSRSKTLATDIQTEVVKQVKLENLNAQYGDYYVLRENPRLSVLVELAFISNYQDELKARSNKFQENAAEGIFEGLIKYFSK